MLFLFYQLVFVYFLFIPWITKRCRLLYLGSRSTDEGREVVRLRLAKWNWKSWLSRLGIVIFVRLLINLWIQSFTKYCKHTNNNNYIWTYDNSDSRYNYWAIYNDDQTYNSICCIDHSVLNIQKSSIYIRGIQIAFLIELLLFCRCCWCDSVGSRWPDLCYQLVQRERQMLS